MLSASIKGSRVHYFHIRHFGCFIDGGIGRVIIIHAEQADGTLIIPQFELFRKVAVYLRDELHCEWSAVKRIEDCHILDFFLGGRDHQFAKVLLTLSSSTLHQKPGSCASSGRSVQQTHPPQVDWCHRSQRYYIPRRGRHPCHRIWVYNPYTRSWTRLDQGPDVHQSIK